MNQFFASSKEFSFIESLFDPSHFAKNGKGIGDDAFLFESGGEVWAISTDSSIEGIHYRMDWGSLEQALEKALLSNLSDINAMGGRTQFALFNLGALHSWDQGQISRIGETLRKLEAAHGFKVVGGDTVTKSLESFFNFTVLGRISGRPLLRSQAQVGHRIYISGSLGRSAAGLALFKQGYNPISNPEWKAFFTAHLLPCPPLGLGSLLSACTGPVAAIDISDGLSSELGHISAQSGCRMVLDWSKLVQDESMRILPGGKENLENWILNGGEEYQLLFTGDFSPAELARLGSAGGWTIHEIGKVEKGSGVGIIDASGKETELKARGWSH